MKREAPDPSAPFGDQPERVLILAPTGGDAEITSQVLEKQGIHAESVPDSEALCREIDRGVGVVIITSEALDRDTVGRLSGTLSRQPRWSEIPILVFTGAPQQTEAMAETYDMLGERAHVTLVDRPIRIRSLVSATQSALRARRRQYDICNLLGDLERHVDRLSGLADASLAIASAGSLHDVLTMINDQARKLLGAEIAVTRVATDIERGQSITVASASKRFHAWASELTRTQVTDLGYVLGRITKPVRTSPGAPREKDLVAALFTRGERHPIAGLVAAPLVERDESNIGFIVVSNKAEGRFTPDDETVLVQLAQMASAGVQKARLYREAQEASVAKDDFLATLAHELRTPMTSILGWVQLLKGADPGRADIEEAVRMIESSTRVQAALVEDLLDVSRIISGKLRIVATATELGPLIENVTTTFKNAAARDQIDLQTDLEESPLSVWGDPTRLQQIVWNLLSNAVKFTAEGGTIRVTLCREGDEAVIRVADTGEGIDAEFLPHVFERFKQAEGGTRRSHGGLGLGLAIVRHLVDSHGGTIEATSEGVGKGAEFTVRLPLTAVRTGAQDDERETIAAALRGRKFLVVDDDDAARDLLMEVLKNFDADVQTAGSVREAVSRLITFDADIVISDLHMPGEDGYALIGRLRDLQARFGREIPAIALTGYGRPEDRMRALGSGFRQYVQKPVELLSLARIAADLLGRQ